VKQKSPKSPAIKRFEKELKANDCLHPHLKFDVFGSGMQCIDCPQKWKPVNEKGQFDWLLGDVKNAAATRHSAYEAPRFTKIR